MNTMECLHFSFPGSEEQRTKAGDRADYPPALGLTRPGLGGESCRGLEVQPDKRAGEMAGDEEAAPTPRPPPFIPAPCVAAGPVTKKTNYSRRNFMEGEDLSPCGGPPSFVTDSRKEDFNKNNVRQLPAARNGAGKTLIVLTGFVRMSGVLQFKDAETLLSQQTIKTMSNR